MAAWASQFVPRIGRKVSVVPSTLIFWIAAIVLCGYQTGVEGDCQIVCASNSYCACRQNPVICITSSFPETTAVDERLFEVTVTMDPPGTSTIRIVDDTGDAESMFRVDGLQVFLNNSFDYESVVEYTFTIECSDDDENTWSSESDSLTHRLEVIDNNDNIPYFDQSIIYASIEEDADMGTELITNVPIRALDLDAIDDGFMYSIVENVPFIITAGCEREVYLSLDGTVDFEEQENYTITIVAKDGCTGGFDPNEGYVTVIVQVNDTDDEPPAFDEDSYSVTIPERDGTFVYNDLSASDLDSLDAPLQYSFIGQSGDWGCLDYLTIDPETAVVTVSKELDYETSLDPCIITVQVVQEDNCMMTATTTLTVNVTDVNECPTFTSDSFSGQLTIDDPFVFVDDGSERLTISMTDEDLEFNGEYDIESSEVVELVKIQGSEGSRTRSFYIKFLDPTSVVMTDTEILISLSDNTTDVECAVATANITVQLMADSMAPNFTQINYHGNVVENATEGTAVIQVAALNSDQTSEGVVYRLQMASDGGEYVFDIDADSGVVSVAVNDSIDAELVKQYTLIVEAVDERGTYYRSSITSVIIDVTDVNEFPPMLTEDVIEVDIEEEVPVGLPVLTVQANDLDVDAVLVYSIMESDVPFKIDPETGDITTNGSLDRDDATTMYNITVVVTDGSNEDECRVMITLTDINDNAPIFTGGPYEVSVSENATDTEIIELQATDIDEGINAEIVYVLESPEGELFSVDNETGLVYANGPFDYENVKEYTLVIRASDPNFSTLTTVIVTITDINDNAPVITKPCSYIEILEDANVGDVICTVVAEDVDEDGTDTITYSLDPSMVDVPFTIDDNTGKIQIKEELNREADDNYTITIIAEDSGSLSSNTTITVIVLDVNDEYPMFDNTAISVRLQVDDLANPPVLLIGVIPTDADLPPWDIIQCEKTSGEESFVVLTGQDGSCDIYAYENLATSPDPYTVSFYAFNPDNRARRSENVTLSVDIRDNICYVAFVNETDYDVIVLESDLESSMPVVTLEITSNCNSDDVTFQELSQSYRSDMDSADQSSQNFTLDEQTGDISPMDIVMEGEHVLLVSAYNQSDPGVKETTTVRITVTGVNRHAPAFIKNAYTAHITNDSIVLVIDLGLEVIDDDSPSFATGEVMFSKVSEIETDSGGTSAYFTVDPDGKVKTSQDDLNQINIGTFKLVVMVMDGAIDPLSNTAEVVINVDVDQTIPVVVPPMITKNCDDTVEIEEEVDPPLFICDIDASSSYDDRIIFGLDSFSEYFTIDADSGKIATRMAFDYETDERTFTLLVYAEGATSKLRNYTSISVIVVDVNDNEPDFSESQIYFSMEENIHESTDCITFVGLIQSTDADSESNQDVTYTTDREDFQVLGNNLTAVACIKRIDVDYSSGMVDVTITALNIGFKENKTTDVVVVVNVEDLNDNAPKFLNDPEDFNIIVEDLASRLIVFVANASDGDAGPYNNEFVFSLAESQEDVIYSLFKMSSDGVLTVRDILISELADMYEVIVMVTDMGQPPLNSSQTITVYVGIIDVTKPYFPVENRTRTIGIDENAEDCQIFPAPEMCNSTDVQVRYELVVDPASGTDFFHINETVPELCISELDREVSSSYTVTLTAFYEPSDVCNSTDGTTRKRRAVEEVESNTIVFTVIVNDVIDSPPSLQFPGNRTNHAYYLAAIDSTQFGSDVLTVTAKDADATSKFSYALTSLPEGDVDGTIVIDGRTGRITTSSLLYPWLSDSGSWEWEDNNFPENRTQDRYNVTVCDVIDDPEAPQCDSASLTFKILLSFEHIIIQFDTSAASIIPQQDTIIRCIAEKMDPTNNLELYLQFLSPVSSDVTMTDMWLYGVDTSELPSSPYLKFDDFITIWENATGIAECSDSEMTPRHLRLSKQLNVTSKTTTSIESWVLVALGIIVFIGNLICIILLLVSWRNMLEDGGRHLARELTVKEDNLEEKLEKGIVNPVFNYNEYDEMDIMATEADEDAAGSEEPLITTVYLTDGKTQSTIAMASDDEPTNVTTAVGTDDDVLILPPPPTGREYDSAEEEMDVYPFDEPEEGFKYKDDDPSHKEDTQVAPNDSNDSATTPEVESSAADTTLPPVDYETETKNKDGSENKEKKMEAESSIGASDSGVEPDDPHYDYQYPPHPVPVAQEMRPVIELPVDDNTEDLPLLPPNGVEPDDPHYDYQYPPHPVPLAQETRPVIELPVDDKTEDLPLPPPPPPILPPIVPPIDYADGKTVTFGGETVVGEGAGDGGSTTTDQDTASESSARSSATDDTNQTPTKGLSNASFNAELKRAVASMKAGKGVRPVSPQSGGESEGESIGYLDDESLISASEIMVTGL